MTNMEMTRVNSAMKEWLKESGESTRNQEELMLRKLDDVCRAKPLNGKRVLLVENHLPLRNVVDQVLKCAGADVTTVVNGIQAYQLAQDSMQKCGLIPYDLMLMDSEMNRVFLTTLLT